MSDLIRVVIVDDEAPARAIVREYLSAHPRFEVLAECANGFDAVKAVSEHRPDLLFLDIQMPKLDGFEVLELLDPKPKVIFVTAYDEYALRAFEVHAIDYLLKPFTPERFAEVLGHAEELIRQSGSQALAKLGGDAARARKPLQRIVCRVAGNLEVVPVHRIDYIEAQDDYVHVYSKGQKSAKQQTLGDLEELLDASRFVRVHRSYL